MISERLRATSGSTLPWMRSRTLSTALGVAFCLMVCSEALAATPPTVQITGFDSGTQTLSFDTDRDEKETVDWSVTSDGDTTFVPDPPMGTDDDPAADPPGVESNSVGATPGPTALVGEVHKLTITVTNANGTNNSWTLLKVVAGAIPNTLVYISFDPIPAVSEWGVIVMVLLLLTAGTFILGRGRHAATA